MTRLKYSPAAVTLILFTLLVSLLPGRFPVQAQSTALQVLQPVSGIIDSTTQEQRWTFAATKGQSLAVRVQATSGNLDPYVELLDSTGAKLASSSSGSYRNATIEAFPVPDTATYTFRVTHMPGTTSGGYTLTVLPGFSFLLLNDPTGARAPMRLWREPNALAQMSSNKLRLQLTADNAYTWTTADKLGALKDVYIQVDLQAEAITSYWEGGILFRGIRQDNALVFYVFFVNSDGKYKLAVAQAGGLNPIQDWTPLPVTVQSNPTLGVMAKNDQITLFYSGSPLTTISDHTLTDGGVIGVAVGTGRTPNNSTSILFDSFIVTLPASEADQAPVAVPPQLTQWQRAAMPILEELQAARMIPSVGKPGVEVGSAFVTNNTAKGIVLLPLAKSISFTDLVYTADITWDSSNENMACGLEFRSVDDKNFSIVYIDRKGGYGILQRAKDGDVVSLYNLSDTIKKDNRATNRVTIIAIGNGLVVYINGTLIANLNARQATGITYIAAYNYDRSSSVCQFSSIWLRSFDR